MIRKDRTKKKRVSGLRRAMHQTRTTAMYPGVGQGLAPALSYVGLGLVGEAGEVANQLKKVMRDDGGLPTPSRSAKLFDELGDVLWYWLRVCDELGFDPYSVMDHNLAKLAQRKRDGLIQGDTAADGSRGGAELSVALGSTIHAAMEAERQRVRASVASPPSVCCASAEYLKDVPKVLGQLVYVVDEQQTYELDIDNEWHRIQDEEGVARREAFAGMIVVGSVKSLAQLGKTPGQLVYVDNEQQVYRFDGRDGWGAVGPAYSPRSAALLAEELYAPEPGPIVTCATAKELQDVPKAEGKMAFVQSDSQTYQCSGGEWLEVGHLANTLRFAPPDEVPSVLETGGATAHEPERFATSQEAWKRLVEAQAMPGHEGRELHLIECHCACAVGGSSWVVSGYRLLGVTQDMYEHLREAHVVVAGE